MRVGFYQCKGGQTLDEVCRAPTESAILEKFKMDKIINNTLQLDMV